MISCQGCRTENSVDSKFCKFCGAVLGQQAAQATVKPEEIDDLLREGFGLVHDGNLPEALFVAERVLSSHAENSGALALKAMALEEQGELGAAIACYEQVVALNPDSTLDRIKLSQLHRKLEQRETPEELEVKSRNWIAVLSAAGAALAVVTVGVVLALSKSTAQAQNGADEPIYAVNQETSPRGFDVNLRQMQEGYEPPVEQQQPGTDGQPQQQSQSRGLPPVVGNPLGSNSTVPPLGTQFLITPEGDRLHGGLPNATGATGRTEVAPQPAPPPPADDQNIIEPPRNDPGRISITPSRGSGAANPNDPEVSENTYRIGQQKMASGDFHGAIRDFQASLAGSRRPAITHQLIGRCYARIGDKANARRHFETALDLYERSGSANEVRAVKRELELLGG